MKDDRKLDNKAAEFVSKKKRTESAERVVVHHSGYAPGFDPLKIKEFLANDDVERYFRVSEYGSCLGPDDG